MPPEVEKVLYLDCDLVVRGDLRQLWGTPFRGKALLAAGDPSGSSALHPASPTMPSWASPPTLPTSTPE